MSDKQKEASACKSMASKYQKIADVFDRMPNRFKLLDLFREAGITDSPAVRAAVGSVLFRDFKCVNVGSGLKRVWKKQEVTT